MKKFATILMLLLATESKAQVELVEIPGSLDQSVSKALNQQHSALREGEMTIERKVKRHNKQCTDIPVGSTEARDCKASMASLQVEVATYYATVKTFNKNVDTLTEVAAGEAAVELETELSRQRQIQELREILSGLQEAIRRLQRSADINQREIVDWANLVEDTQDSTLSLIGRVMLSQSTARLSKLINNRVVGLKKLIGDNPREMVSDYKRTLLILESTQVFFLGGLNYATDMLTAVEIATSERSAKEIALAEFHLGLKRTLSVNELQKYLDSALANKTFFLNESPTLRRIASMSKLMANMQAASIAVDSWYEAGKIVTAWEGIHVTNRNAEGHLGYLKTLDCQIKNTLAKIKILTKEADGTNRNAEECP